MYYSNSLMHPSPTVLIIDQSNPSSKHGTHVFEFPTAPGCFICNNLVPLSELGKMISLVVSRVNDSPGIARSYKGIWTTRNFRRNIFELYSAFFLHSPLPPKLGGPWVWGWKSSLSCWAKRAWWAGDSLKSFGESPKISDLGKIPTRNSPHVIENRDLWGIQSMLTIRGVWSVNLRIAKQNFCRGSSIWRSSVNIEWDV